MGNPYLDKFGKTLMSKVRDSAIRNWDMILDGRMKGDMANNIRQELSTFSDEQRELVYRLIPNIVDTTLHYLLWAIEQEHSIEVIQSLDNNDRADVAEISDGLPGELYTKEGWIERFSTQRYEEP